MPFWRRVVPKAANGWLFERSRVYSFGRQYRLLRTEDFSSVFALRVKKSGRLVQVWQAPNGLSRPRLGLVVPKKAAKRANRRNYMKRVLREWFRLHRSRLAPNDIVIRVGTAFDAAGREQVWAELADLVRVR